MVLSEEDFTGNKIAVIVWRIATFIVSEIGRVDLEKFRLLGAQLLYHRRKDIGNLIYCLVEVFNRLRS